MTENEDLHSSIVPQRFETAKTRHMRRIVSHECVKTNNFFAGRDPLFFSALREVLHVQMFGPGEVIINEGDEGESMYLLNYGRVEVSLSHLRDPVAVLEAGSFFGEIAVLGVSRKRTSTVRALEFCDCRVLYHHSFHAVAKNFPKEHASFQAMANLRKDQLVSKKKEEELKKPMRSTLDGANFRKKSVWTDPKMRARLSFVTSLIASRRHSTMPAGLSVSLEKVQECCGGEHEGEKN